MNGKPRRAFLARAFVSLGLAAAALLSPAPAGAMEPEVEWNPAWPRFRKAEIALTAGLSLQVAANLFLYPAPQRNWEGGILFDDAVRGAADAPKPDDAAALGRLLYILHLAVLLWWLLDRSPAQKATQKMLAMLDRVLPLAAFALRLEPARAFVHTADALCREAFFGNGDEGTELAAEVQP